MSRKPPPIDPPNDDVVVPSEAPKPKGKAAEVREIGRVALDKIRISRENRVVDPPKGQPANGVKPGKWTANEWGLPKEHPCPVVVCGVDGARLWCFDVNGQLRDVDANPFGQGTIQSLFGYRQGWLYWAAPRLKKAGTDEDGNEIWVVDTWRAELVREMMWTAASLKGTWTPAEGVRGRGAWKDGQGRLLYHFGDGLFHGGKVRGVDEVDGKWYVAAKPIPRPWSEPVDDEANPAPELVRAFRTFNWARPAIDPVLALGLLGEMLITAALEWRAHGYVDGPSGSGKSTLLGLFRDILGPIVVFTTDTTAAGIYQQMQYEGRPVILDEVEADNPRSIDLVKLARTSSDEEGQMSRGGADHKSVQFELRSAILMAGINRPVMAPQDLNRFLLLTLHPLGAATGTGGVRIEGAIDTFGPKLLRRLIDGWGEFEAVYQAIATVLREAGHEPRGQKTYGVPLALAILMLGDVGLDELGLPMENFGGWAHLVGRAEVAHEGEVDNWRGALNHLMGARIEIWRHGQQTMVGQLLEAMRHGGEHATTPEGADAMLGQIGLKLLAKGAPRKGEEPRKGWRPGGEGWWLAVPNEGDQLGEIYRGTAWGSTVRGKGGWSNALRQCPAALGLISTDKTLNKIRVNGWQGRATLVDLDQWFRLMEEEE